MGGRGSSSGVSAQERKSMDNMTWQEFQKWQRSDDPPLTVDPCFFMKEKSIIL